MFTINCQLCNRSDTNFHYPVIVAPNWIVKVWHETTSLYLSFQYFLKLFCCNFFKDIPLLTDSTWGEQLNILQIGLHKINVKVIKQKILQPNSHSVVWFLETAECRQELQLTFILSSLIFRDFRLQTRVTIYIHFVSIIISSGTLFNNHIQVVNYCIHIQMGESRKTQYTLQGGQQNLKKQFTEVI